MTHRINISVPDHVKEMIDEYNRRNSYATLNISGICTNAIADKIRAIYPKIEDELLRSSQKLPEEVIPKEVILKEVIPEDIVPEQRLCLECKSPLDGKKRDYCSEKCRSAYRRNHKKVK